MTDSQHPTRAQRLGRRIGLGAFILLVSTFTAVCTLQIVRQVWFSRVPSGSADCRPGVRSLLRSVERGRRAAANETGGERAALARFGAHVAAPLEHRDSLRTACSADSDALAALTALDALLAAERKAVRQEPSDVERHRREAANLTARLFPDD